MRTLFTFEGCALRSKFQHAVDSSASLRYSQVSAFHVWAVPLLVRKPNPIEMATLRVLVVDDHESVRKGVCAILGSRADVEICAEAANGKEAVSKTDALQPQVIVMDVSMPEMDGISATREILKVHPSTAIIILSMHDSKQLVESARKTGARGYVTKGQAGSTLLDAIDAVAQGKEFFPS
jgi:two-component system, NarL family, nitrate/nitrite response regulator NarL